MPQKPDSRSQEVVREEAKRKLHASNAARKDTLPINAPREQLTKIRMKRKSNQRNKGRAIHAAGGSKLSRYQGRIQPS
jgi:hypothetical protein